MWKSANVVPIYKKGDKSDVSNYRPVSILCAFAKVFESIICPIINWHSKNFLTDAQHGFRKNKSTVSNLMSFISIVSKSVDSRVQVDAIYTDFSSAFDKVDHNVLLRKLKHYGVHGTLWRWFKSYLSNRVLRVVVAGYESETVVPTSGVPQGSHLGPILFLIFINDITNIFQYCNYSLFADDLKIYMEIRSLDDVSKFQLDLYALVEWCNNNNMYLNASKCFHIKFTRNKHIIPSHYVLGNNIILEEVNIIKDLGVLLDSKLSFREHVDNIVKKSSKTCGFIKRQCKSFKNIYTMKVLFNTLIRSGLEYASAIWNPSYKVHISRIEKVQSNFTKFLAYRDRTCPYRAGYEARLDHFRMTSLSDRRCIADMSFLHSLVCGVLNAPDLLHSLFLIAPPRKPILSRRQPIKKTFQVKRRNTNLGRNIAIVRLTRVYNELAGVQKDVDIFCQGPSTFKRSIASAISTLRDKSASF